MMRNRPPSKIFGWLRIALMFGCFQVSTTPAGLPPEAEVERVVELINSGQYELAINAAQKVIDRDPRSSRAHAFHGYALESLGRFALAEDAYRRAIDLEDSLLMPRRRLGVLYGRRQRHRDCIAALAPVRERINHDPEALFYLSKSYFETGRSEEGLQAASEIETSHSNDGGVLLSLGSLLMFRGYWERAERILRQAGVLQADSFSAKYGLGIALFQLGRSEEAVRALDQALALDPNSEKTRIALVLALLKTGVRPRAEQLLRSVLSRNPSNAYASFLLGQILLEQRLYEEGVLFLRKATELDPQKPEYSFELVEAYHLKGDAQAALEQARRLVTLFPGHPGSYLNLGTELKLAGEFEKAKPLLKRSLELARLKESPANRDSWTQSAFHLASILRREGSSREAVELLTQVVEDRPEPVALIELSYCHIQSGEPEKALPLLEKAISLDPDNPEPRFLHASVLVKLGRMGEASKEFEMFQRVTGEQKRKKNLPAERSKAPPPGPGA